MAEAKPAVAIHPGRHVTWYGDDTQRARAMAILTALLGAYGRKGGMFLPTKVKPGRIPLPPFPESERGRADGGGTRYPAGGRGVAGTDPRSGPGDDHRSPYPIKGWIVYGQNILESIPQRQNTLKAIEQLEFMAVVDVLPVEQTNYADLVLPEATYLGALRSAGNRHDVEASVRCHSAAGHRAAVRIETRLVDRQADGEPPGPCRLLSVERSRRSSGAAR